MKASNQLVIRISKKVLTNTHLTPKEITLLLNFQKPQIEKQSIKLLKKSAVPLSLTFGFFFTVFPTEFEALTASLPQWTNLHPQLLAGINYFWDLIGDPVKKVNILYHIPNIILYSFGFFGLKKIIDTLEKKSWLDQVLEAKAKLLIDVDQGKLNIKMNPGHSILFSGNGDFIAMQQTINSTEADTVTISQTKPTYTQIWNRFDIQTLFDDLKDTLKRSDAENCGEYIFFPVKDDQIFLPNEKAYDLSPHKLDILVQNIRIIEKEENWTPKRIIIIGDKFHKSYVHSEDQRKIIEKSRDVISLTSIIKKYPNMTLIDPSDIVLKEIIKIAKGRKIVFRATKEGIAEYKKRFFERLKNLGYTQDTKIKGILTIGYDLFEDQTEQQTLSRKIDDYIPVVLSKPVHDALLRNGYTAKEFLYVPNLVLNHLLKISAQQ